jgi:hypothetical protein
MTNPLILTDALYQQREIRTASRIRWLAADRVEKLLLDSTVKLGIVEKSAALPSTSRRIVAASRADAARSDRTRAKWTARCPMIARAT